ncbi:MAG TPA: acid-soluble spore protein [Ruminococcaceae bacterium]|nr:acid-soluble spore protein [Oscillospiraceae bacterium]
MRARKGEVDAWNRFKLECADEVGHLEFCKEFNDHDKGDLTARENGSQGGPIGGQMTKKMIEYYKSQHGQG